MRFLSVRGIISLFVLLARGMIAKYPVRAETMPTGSHGAAFWETGVRRCDLRGNL